MSSGSIRKTGPDTEPINLDLEKIPEGPVTLMFTDIESSTEVTARVGDEGWRDLVGRQHETVRAVASEHGGRVIKSLGDGLMLVFNSARRAVNAAVAIQSALAGKGAGEEALGTRIGINSGEVAHDQGDMLGLAVNAASRIAAKAQAGQILAAEVVRQLVGTVPGVEFRDKGRTTLKGFPERWRLFEIVSTWPSEGASRRTEFVGREEEREGIRARLGAALGGRGGVVMIGGEPGIGKTRLAEEIAAEARNRGALALTGRCYETDSPLPYAPWVEMTNTIARIAPRDVFREVLGEDAPEVARLAPELRRIFPDIPQPIRLPPEQERHYLFTSILNYLERSSRMQPVILILDDLHWSDEASLLLLTHVAQRAEEMAIFLIGTYRDIELEVARPLARTLEDLLRRRLASRVTLRRFSVEGVEKLLVALTRRALAGSSRDAAGPPPPPLVKIIYRETEGNPFFVEEVFEHLREEGKVFDDEGRWRSDIKIEEFEVPESVRLVIGRRLERLSDPTRRVLTTASLIGGSLSYDLLGRLEGEDPDALADALDEAEHAHLISTARRGSETRITFGHELIRQTLLSSVSLPKRQRLHVRIADAMENLYSSAGTLFDHAGDVAHHLYQAGVSTDSERTLRYLSFAGDLALNSAAFEEAAHHYEQALEFHSGEDSSSLADLKFSLGFAQRGAGRWDLALASWNDSLSIYERRRDETAARVARAISYQLSWGGRSEESREVSERGLAMLDESPTRERARLLAVAAMNTGLLGDAGAYELIDEAQAIADKLGNERVLLEVLSARSVIEWGFMRPLPCIEVSQRAAEGYKRRGDLFQWVGVANFLEQSLTMAGRWDEADRIGLEFGPVAEKMGHLGTLLPHARSMRYRRFASTGDISEFAAAAATDFEIAERVDPNWRGQSFTYLAEVRFRQGRWDEALEAASRGAAQEPKGVYEGMNRSGVSTIVATAGTIDDALELISDVRPPADLNVPIPLGRKILMLSSVEVLTIANERKRAGDLYDFAAHAVGERLFFRFFDSRPTHLSAALGAAALGDWAAAAKHFGDTMELLNSLGVRMQIADSKRLWATALENWAPERRDEARQILLEAAEGYAELGMKRFEELARSKADGLT